MRLHGYKKKPVLLCAFLVLLLTGCAPRSVTTVLDITTMKPDYSEIYHLTEADLNTEAENAEEIRVGEQGIFIIDRPGDYILSGEQEGQLQIDVEDEIVHLILDNVEMKSYSGPAIYVKSAAKVVITIPERSSCILTDSTNYADFAEAKGCIYSASDLTINGGGNLNVYGYYKDAIRTKDTLKVLDISLEVQAKDTGLRGNDGVVIQTEALHIESEGSGIYTEKENKANKGFVDIAKGEVSIIAGEYGIRASENVYVHDCRADIFGVVQHISCMGEQYVEEGCLE